MYKFDIFDIFDFFDIFLCFLNLYIRVFQPYFEPSRLSFADFFGDYG